MTQPSKRFKALLVVSLLLNVFLIGGVAGGLYQWHNQAKPMLAMPQHGLRKALVQLPPAKRHQLRQLLRQTRLENQPLIAASRDARLDVIRQLQAPTLDRSALESDMGKAREADINLRAKVDANLAEFASTLPPEERQTLVESMFERGNAKGRAANRN
ncbi:periplasmic heavy metal sensor [Rhodococcus sp. IEGM1300]